MEQSNGKNPWDGSKPDPITQTKEGWYDKLLSRVPLSVKMLDWIIVILIALAIAVMVFGVLKGNGTL